MILFNSGWGLSGFCNLSFQSDMIGKEWQYFILTEGVKPKVAFYLLGIKFQFKANDKQLI
ncbi:hypothetical protein [Pantoea sp. SGAir0183]